MRVNTSSRSLASFVFLCIVAISHATVFWMPVWKQTTVLRYHPKKGWYPVKHGGTGSTFLKPKKLPPLTHVLKNIQKQYKLKKPHAPPLSSGPLAAPHHKKYRGWRKKPSKPIVHLPIIKDPGPPLGAPHIPCISCHGPHPSSWKKPLSKPHKGKRPFLKSFRPSRLKLKSKPHKPSPPPPNKPNDNLPDFPPSLFRGAPFPPTDFLPKPSPHPKHKRKRRPSLGKVAKAYNPFHKYLARHRHFPSPHSQVVKKPKHKPKHIRPPPVVELSSPYITLNKSPFTQFPPISPQFHTHTRLNYGRRPRKVLRKPPKKGRKIPPPPKKINHHHPHPIFNNNNNDEDEFSSGFPKPSFPVEPFKIEPIRPPPSSPLFNNKFTSNLKGFNDGPRKPNFKEDHRDDPSLDELPKVTSFFSTDFEPLKLKPMFPSDSFEDNFEFPKDPPKSLKTPEKSSPDIFYIDGTGNSGSGPGFGSSSNEDEEFHPSPPVPSTRPKYWKAAYHSPRVPRIKSYPPPPVYPKLYSSYEEDDDDDDDERRRRAPAPKIIKHSRIPAIVRQREREHSQSQSVPDYRDYSDSNSPPRIPSSFKFNGFPPVDYSPKLREFTPNNNFYRSKNFPKTDHLHDLGEQHLPIPKEFADFAFGRGFSGVSGFASGQQGQGWRHWVW